MKVIVTSEFYDLKEDKLRKVGETFEVSNARFDEIVKKGGEWVEEANEVEKDAEEANETVEVEAEEAATVEEMETVEEADNKAKKNTTPKKAGAKNDGGRTKKA